MMIRILAFLLETVSFLLVGAALLRAWMNWTRVNMRAQPGIFVMAMTDWLVKPLRRSLPAALRHSSVDWASVMAAVLLALAYTMLWGWLFGVLPGVAPSLPDFGAAAVLVCLVVTLKMLLYIALQTMMILVIGFAILSWIQPGSAVYSLLGQLTEPLLAPLRRIVPVIGGVDLSALVLILILQIGLMVLR